MTYVYSVAMNALGDPTRRAIFERVAERPRAVGELALQMAVTRPAVSQHLRVLKEAGLVTDTPDGAKRIYRIDPRGIGAMREWLDAQWVSALNGFAGADAAKPETNAEEDPLQ